MIALVIGSFILAIICAGPFIEKDSPIMNYMSVPVFLIVLGFGVLMSTGGCYQASIVEVEEMKAQQINILSNYRTLAQQLNQVAVVKTNGDKILVDLPNAYQSTNASKAAESWIDSANKFNKDLAHEIGIRKMNWMGKLWYGWRCPLDKELRYIEIKELVERK